LGTANLGCSANSASACLLDPVVASGTKSGYTLDTSAHGTNNVRFVATAAPVMQTVTGNRIFCIDATLVLRFELGGGAPADDIACQNLQPVGQGQ
jgi:hypothetical protein